MTRYKKLCGKANNKMLHYNQVVLPFGDSVVSAVIPAAPCLRLCDTLIYPQYAAKKTFFIDGTQADGRH